MPSVLSSDKLVVYQIVLEGSDGAPLLGAEAGR